MKAVSWVSIATLLIASAGLWSHLAPFGTAVRFAVTAGAIVVMFKAFHDRRYALGTVLGALALLYNPAFPVFGFAGNWQRALLVASGVPFVASLAWAKREDGAK